MWHEARKQEKKIRGMLVDYRKRAERRQDFYERIKADPTQFLQVHGRKCKIHLDVSVAAAAENPAIMMPWLGNKDNLIDRFDVRAHLDFIPAVLKTEIKEDDLCMDERNTNYERYRILAQNEFLGINEEKFLHQLFLEEQFGVNAQLEAELKASSSKKKSSVGAAIGYTYDENEVATTPFSQTISAIESSIACTKYDDCMKDDSDSDLDMDVSIDINKVGNTQAHEMNACGRHYGMKSNDFYSFLTKDADEADAQKMAREEEQEKIMYSGRKSRRERRAQRERKFAGRPLSPPSYAAKEDIGPQTLDEQNDSSRSPSPINSGKITYITSFGGEDELQPHSKISINFTKGSASGNQSASSKPMTYAEKVKQNLEKLKVLNHKDEPGRKPLQYQRRSSSRSRSRSNSRRRYRSRRSRSNSRGRSRHFSRYTRRRSLSRIRSRSKSRSRSKKKIQRKSRSSSSSYSSPKKHLRQRVSSSSSSSSPAPVRKIIKQEPSSSSSTSPASTSSSDSEANSPIKKEKSPPPATKALKESAAMELRPISPKIEPKPEELPPSDPPVVAVVSIKQEPLETPCILEPEPQVPIKKYYGRKRDDESSSDDLSGPEEAKNDEAMDASSNPASAAPVEVVVKLEKPDIDNSSSRFGKTPTINTPESKISLSVTPSSKSSVNPRDRLKRKMQILLNKQFKADKKAEIEKTERQIQQQQEREDEMRELALKLRRRQRELRHKYGTPESSKSKSAESAGSDEEKEKEPVKEEEPKPPASDGVVIEKKPVLRRLMDIGRSRSRSRIRKRSRSRSKSRSRKRSVSNSRAYNSYNRYNDRDRRRSRERQRTRSRERRRVGDYSRRDYDRDNDRYNRGRRKSRSVSRNRRSWSRGRRSQSRSRGNNNRRERPRSPKHGKKLVDY